MKPDWKDAPEWANWVACETSGEWFWYDEAPEWDGEEWVPVGENWCSATDAANSLEQRP